MSVMLLLNERVPAGGGLELGAKSRQGVPQQGTVSHVVPESPATPSKIDSSSVGIREFYSGALPAGVMWTL